MNRSCCSDPACVHACMCAEFADSSKADERLFCDDRRDRKNRNRTARVSTGALLRVNHADHACGSGRLCLVIV